MRVDAEKGEVDAGGRAPEMGDENWGGCGGGCESREETRDTDGERLGWAGLIVGDMPGGRF